MIPDELKERLDKADGHLNAADRRLWNETERALWSAHQAVARLAEVWFRLDGSLDALPPVEKYLPRDVMSERVQSFAQACETGDLAAAWSEVVAAEHAVLAEPFLSPPEETKETLTAGLQRQHRYIGSLRALKLAVEERVGNRYVTLRAGDWFRLHDGQVGRLIALRGLHAHFLLPMLAEDSPTQAFRCYVLGFARLQQVARPDDMPLDSPAYHLLRNVAFQRRAVQRVLAAERFGDSDLYRALHGALDATAKAWRGVFDPGGTIGFSHVYARNSVPYLAGRAPTSIFEPLDEALQRNEAMFRAAIATPKPGLAELRHEGGAILELIDQALAVLDDLLDQEIELKPGEWVRVPDYGSGRLVQRDRRRIVVDLGGNGVLAGPLTDIRLRHALATTDGEPADSGPLHARWLWHACHPEDWEGRILCPCCGLPGVPEEGTACQECGWRHDGGNFDPYRANWLMGGHDLAQGRSRYLAQGQATPPITEKPSTIPSGVQRVARGALRGRLDGLAPCLVLSKCGGHVWRWARGRDTPGLFDFPEPAVAGRSPLFRKGLLLPVSLCRAPGLAEHLRRLAALLASAPEKHLPREAHARRLALQDWLEDHDLGYLRLQDKEPTSRWLRLSLAREAFSDLLTRFDYVTAVLDGPDHPIRILEHAPFRWSSRGAFLDWSLGEETDEAPARYALYFVAEATDWRGLQPIGGDRTQLVRPPHYWAPYLQPSRNVAVAAPSVRFVQEPDDYGWITLELGLGDHTATVMLSDAYDPFPAILDWLQAVVDGDLPMAVVIDDEGSGAVLAVHALGSDKLLVAVLDHRDNTCLASAAVHRQVFVETWRNALVPFLTDELDPYRWNSDDENSDDPRQYRSALLSHGFFAAG